MALQTCTVNCTVYEQDGQPVADARIEATLNTFEVYAGHIVPRRTLGTTDENGQCALQLWPNALGSVGSAYDVKISYNGKTLRTTAVVPNIASTTLHECSTLPPFPGKLEGQLAIEEAQEAGLLAQSAKADAQSAASASAASAANAAASAVAASASAGAASTSAGAAATSASAASTSAGAASTSAGAASTSASEAEAAKNVILAIDPLPKAGGTMTGTLNGTSAVFSGTVEVAAGATGAKVPQAQEIPAAVKTTLNASGSAPVYACRAWVNFDGTGTVAIRDSGNVSSVTDMGTGTYEVNFTTAMQDANHAVLVTVDAVGVANIFGMSSIARGNSTTKCGISCVAPPSTLTDASQVNVAIFR